MIAQLPNLDTILKRHEIHPKFWPEIPRLRRRGPAPQQGTGDPLEPRDQLQGGLKEILAELSKGLEHKFPPADYQSPVPYESLPVRRHRTRRHCACDFGGCAVRSPSSNQTPVLLGWNRPTVPGRVDRRSHHSSLLTMKGQP